MNLPGWITSLLCLGVVQPSPRPRFSLLCFLDYEMGIMSGSQGYREAHLRQCRHATCMAGTATGTGKACITARHWLTPLHPLPAVTNSRGLLPSLLYEYANKCNRCPFFLYFYTRVYMPHARSQHTFSHKRPESKYARL